MAEDDKAVLRKTMRARRNALSVQDMEALSHAAQRHILDDPAWLRAGLVGLYVSVRSEVRTGMLCHAAWNTGKGVCLPYTPGFAASEMHLLPCPVGAPLVPNRFGIPEPVPAVCLLPEESAVVPDILIVPGLVFDRQGCRIGSGGGYYDRMLTRPQMRNVVRIGLAYDFQVSPTPLVADSWDIPMNALATEEGLLWI